MAASVELSKVELEDLVGLTEAEGKSRALPRADSVAVVDAHENRWFPSDARKGRVTLYVDHGQVTRAVNG